MGNAGSPSTVRVNSYYCIIFLKPDIGMGPTLNVICQGGSRHLVLEVHSVGRGGGIHLEYRIQSLQR